MDKERILNLILSEIYNATTADELLIYDTQNGRFIVAGQVLPAPQSEQIIEAAKALKNNLFLEYLLKELEYDGTRRMALKAADFDAVRFPKANLYAANLIRTKINTISNLTIKKPKVAKEETRT